MMKKPKAKSSAKKSDGKKYVPALGKKIDGTAKGLAAKKGKKM